MFCTLRVRQLEAWQACTSEPDSDTLFEKRRECNPSLSFPVSALPVYITKVRNLERLHVHCQKATWRSMRCHTIAVHCTGSKAAASGGRHWILARVFQSKETGDYERSYDHLTGLAQCRTVQSRLSNCLSWLFDLRCSLFNIWSMVWRRLKAPVSR